MAPAVRHCTQCGTELPGAARFCASCGTPTGA
jgi:rRNA maturation endonuclease Nob1